MIDLDNIENTVCLAVNEALSGLERYHGGMVDRTTLYTGNSRVPLCVSVARQFSYLVMHDLYNLPYAVIARRSGYAVRNVVGGVAKARHLLHVDDIYIAVFAMIRKYLNC